MAGCLNPFVVNHGQMNETPVPCGKCIECLKRRISGWSFRLMQQDRVSDSSFFITLTYDTTKVPITKNGFMDLSKRDMQLFWKRLRKAQEKSDFSEQPIKYFCVGEYGGRTRRPHYHAIVFNAKLDLIQPAWDMGHVHYGMVAEASVGYTLKYMMKPTWKPMHINDDRQPQFQLMSKGLGLNYLTPQMVQWHKNDLENRMYCNLKDGKKIAMPRYYKLKMYNEDEMSAISYHLRKKLANEKEKEIQRAGGIDAYWHNKTEAIKWASQKLQREAASRRTI